MSIVRDSKSARPELLLGSGWEKLVEVVLITDFIGNPEQGREYFLGL